MKYIIGLLTLCFCLSLSVDVGAVSPQHCQTEFVAESQPIFCEVLVLDFAIRPTFPEQPIQVPIVQPGESHGNPERSCGPCEVVNVTYPSLHIEATTTERCRNCTTERIASAPAKEVDQECLSDWKVGWQNC